MLDLWRNRGFFFRSNNQEWNTDLARNKISDQYNTAKDGGYTFWRHLNLVYDSIARDFGLFRRKGEEDGKEMYTVGAGKDKAELVYRNDVPLLLKAYNDQTTPQVSAKFYEQVLKQKPEFPEWKQRLVTARIFTCLRWNIH